MAERQQTTLALLEQAEMEHGAAAHVLNRQGGTEVDTIRSLLRAQLLMLEVLRRLA